MATRSPRPSRPFRWTRAHLARLPDDGNRYEVLDGALLVTPQARMAHQRCAFVLGFALESYCDQHGLGTVFVEGKVVFGRNELQPDVQVVPVSRQQAMAGTWEDAPRPLLVIEVLSPDSARHDRISKRAAYARIGIVDYWIVDLGRRRVEVCRPDSEEPVIVTDRVRWMPRAGIPPLEMQLDPVFDG